MFATYADSWFVSAVPLLPAIIMAVADRERAAKALRELGGEIRSFEDLERLRPAIDLSMILAMAYLGLVLAFMGALGACAVFTDMSNGLAVLHLGFFFGVGVGPFLWARPKERALRHLTVTAQDPEVEARYRKWLVMWDEARLRLPR